MNLSRMRKPEVMLVVLLALWPGWCLQAQPPSPKLRPIPPDEAVQKKQDAERYRATLLFADILELIRNEYVDPHEVDYEKLTYSALQGMLSSLDPYSEFLAPDEFQMMRTETEGEFGGLGVYVGVGKGGALIVNMPIEGGPGIKAGLKPGDWIVKIHDKPTKNFTLGESIRQLRGKPGEAVSLVIYRPSTKETIELNVVRELINIPTIRDAHLLPESLRGNQKIGYLRITQFGEKTLEDFDAAMKKLLEEGMEGMVMDLRNNPGGLLDSAVQVAGRFTAMGTVIAFTEGRYKNERVLYRAGKGPHHIGLPLVILINRNSASGAEIVAGALKDLRKAVLLGELSYGKGSVQTVQPVDVKADPPIGIRLTTAKYYTPSRKVIHKKGVPPDIEVPLTAEDSNNVLLRQSIHKMSPEAREKIERLEDNQLSRAISILQGIILSDTKETLTASHHPARAPGTKAASN